jgi:hypothetical protein
MKLIAMSTPKITSEARYTGSSALTDASLVSAVIKLLPARNRK